MLTKQSGSQKKKNRTGRGFSETQSALSSLVSHGKIICRIYFLLLCFKTYLTSSGCSHKRKVDSVSFFLSDISHKLEGESQLQ